MLPELRESVANGLDRVAMACWNGAHRLRPITVHDGPLCPDCQMGPDMGDVECPICRDKYEAQRRDTEIFGSGYEQALEDARGNLGRVD